MVEIRRWFESYLDTLRQREVRDLANVTAIPAWFRNIGKRLIKSPKLIFTDTGLLAHLLGGEEALARSFGAALENLVLMEIVKQASYSDSRPVQLAPKIWALPLPVLWA